MKSNGIRYSRIKKFAYGTKVPKFSDGTTYGQYGSNALGAGTYGTTLNSGQTEQEANTMTTQGSKSTNTLANSLGGVAGWLAPATQLSNSVRGSVKKNRAVNPVTGEVTEYAANDEGKITEEIAQPYHEKYANDIKNKEYDALGAQLLGGPVGQIVYNATIGKKRNDAKFMKKKQEATDAQTGLDAQAATFAKQQEDSQRDMYSRSYLANNPAAGQEGASIYAAYGTKGKIPKLAMGGDLNPIASNMDKAVGNTHEQGGITLDNEQGEPTAEVENQEVIVNKNQVLSDRLPFTGGKTFAQKGEELAADKAKNEHNLKGTDMFARGTAKRNVEKIDKEVDLLLKYQDVVRKNLGLDDSAPVNNAKYGGTIPKYYGGTQQPYGVKPKGDPSYMYSPGYAEYNSEDDVTVPEFGSRDSGNSRASSDTTQRSTGSLLNNSSNNPSNTNAATYGDYNSSTSKSSKGSYNGYVQAAENLTPYLDNAINYSLIKQTPKIPKPTYRVAQDEMAMNLNTNYNINPNLIANNQDLKEYNTNVLNNTSNSNGARAEMASGFAKKLGRNNELYGQKTNAENQLKDRNSLNLQGVNSKNVENRQSINNLNKGLTDEYNWKNMLREDDIRGQKSKLGAETTNDAVMGIQDRRAGELDNKRILYDSMKYSDGAGLATMIDTPEMDQISQDPESRKKILNTLERTGQHDAAAKYKKKHKM